MQGRQPDPRWAEFENQIDSEGKIIGFKIPNCEYLFEYDSTGGWVDQKGNVFDKNGVALKDDFEQEDESDEDSEADDEEIVDEFEKMLIEQEEGIIRTKSKPENKESKAPVVSENDIDYDQEAKQYIEKLKNKDELRQGLSPQIWIFFKMRSNHYERTVPEVQKKQDVNSKNEAIRQIKKRIEEQRKKLLDSNKWLQGDFFLDYSGTSIENNLYDRYWYGWIKVSHENFFSTLDKIKASSQFAVLRSKTYYALKSKFFLKTKMKDTITDLKNSLSDVKQGEAVLIKINNLPEEFSLSFIIDLIELSGGILEDVIDMDVVDDFSADLIVKKRTAELFTNIEGYPHDQKEFIWLQVEKLKQQPPISTEWFNIEIDADYKNPTREIGDTLAFEYGKNEFVKLYELKDQFRCIVHQNVLKRLLMFRGQTMNIVRVVRFVKKE